MNRVQKRHEARLRARLFAAYLISTTDIEAVWDQPEWFQDMFLEELQKLSARLKYEAKKLAERNGRELPDAHLANHFKK